jgi:ribonuclease Z
LNRLILTHFHPDHTAGVPALFMNSWLRGRTDALDVYGLEDTLNRVEQTMQLYEWESWPNFFPVEFHKLPAEENVLAFESADFRVSVSPVRHMIPVIGVRIESRSTGKVVVYSSDTEPCPEIVHLAAGADLLLHEASGAGYGHSSAAQAGETARQAGVGALFLIHYPTGGFDPQPLIEQAKQFFGGPVTLCRDFMELDF